MDLTELKHKQFGIDRKIFKRVFSFVDFGNVNFWYEKDRRDAEGNALHPDQKLIVDIEKLSRFLDTFSEQKRFYYGWHPRISRSWHILIRAEQVGFIKVTKPIQFIKHYADEFESPARGRNTIHHDRGGKFIEIPKCNFDVEICVDSIRLLDRYDTFCLLSGDSDFARLVEFLRRKNKKVIIIAAGHVLHSLRSQADLYINAQDVKGDLTVIKTKPRPF